MPTEKENEEIRIPVGEGRRDESTVTALPLAHPRYLQPVPESGASYSHKIRKIQAGPRGPCEPNPLRHMMMPHHCGITHGSARKTCHTFQCLTRHGKMAPAPTAGAKITSYSKHLSGPSCGAVLLLAARASALLAAGSTNFTLMRSASLSASFASASHHSRRIFNGSNRSLCRFSLASLGALRSLSLQCHNG